MGSHRDVWDGGRSSSENTGLDSTKDKIGNKQMHLDNAYLKDVTSVEQACSTHADGILDRRTSHA